MCCLFGYSHSRVAKLFEYWEILKAIITVCWYLQNSTFFFSKIFSGIPSEFQTFWIWNQARHCFYPYLGPNRLQMISADVTNYLQKTKSKNEFIKLISEKLLSLPFLFEWTTGGVAYRDNKNFSLLQAVIIIQNELVEIVIGWPSTKKLKRIWSVKNMVARGRGQFS